jgi:hypothetical protein
LLVAVWALAPHQLPVSLYKLSLVSLAAVVGYWLDRSIFPYARPDAFLLPDTEEFEEHFLDEQPADNAVFASLTPDGTLMRLAGVCMLRRAIVIGCAMLAMGLGA